MNRFRIPVFWRTFALVVVLSALLLLAVTAPRALFAANTLTSTGKSLNFDGTNDFVERAPLGSLIGSGDFTLEFWFRANSHANYPILFAQDQSGTGSPAFRAEISSSSNRMDFFFFSGGDYVIVSTPSNSLTVGSCNHYALVRSGNVFTAYLNGVQVATATATGTPTLVGNNFNLRIGARRDSVGTATNPFNGWIDDFRIWNVARTQTEISANLGSELAEPLPASLILNYKMNQGTANGNNSGETIAQDATTNDRDATLNNFALTGNTSNWSDAQCQMDTCTSRATGNWNAIATWNCGHVPSNGNNVVIDNLHTVTLNVDTADLGNFTINSDGTLTNNSTARTLSLTGNWSRGGTFTPGAAIGVTFDGTGTQTLTDTTTFYNLRINNSGGSVTLGNNMTVNGTLTLTSDLTTSSNALILGSGATVAGAKDVVGTVRRANPGTGANLQFNNQYTLLNFSTAPTQLDVVLSKSTPPGFSNAVQRYYTLTPDSAVNATVQLSYQTSELNNNNEGSIQLWRHNGSSWVSQGGTVDQTNHFVSVSGITQFSPWGFGAGAPTSIELASFHARLNKKGKVSVKWETGNELNLIGFNVWRRTGKSKWQQINATMLAAKQIGQVTGAQYRLKDKQVKAGKAYRYKLQLLNADGTVDWSKVSRVKIP